MKSIVIIIKNIKDIFPYLFLISIYFLFVNIEARNNLTRKNKIDQKKSHFKNSEINNKTNNLRITIPVIPYSQ